MSTYVASHKHINALVSYIHNQRFAPRITLASGGALCLDQADHLQIAAEILLAENVRSVQTRYPDTADNPSAMPGRIDEVGQPITFRMDYTPRKPVTILKACDSYDYQACETDDYPQTDAARLIEAIRHKAIRNLPGYDKDEGWNL